METDGTTYQYLYYSYRQTHWRSVPHENRDISVPHIQHQYYVWHLAKSVTKKLGKTAKTKPCSQLSCGSSLFLITYGGLRKHVMLQIYLWTNGNLLYITYPMSTSGTVTLPKRVHPTLSPEEECGKKMAVTLKCCSAVR